MPVGLFGKCPARGDFISAGLPPDVLRPWEDWIAALTADTLGALEPAGYAIWDAAPVLRFWIGGGPPRGLAAGVFLPSRDKVGRRFPLTLLWQGPLEAAPAPPIAASAETDRWFETLAVAAVDIAAPDLHGEPTELTQALADPPPSGLAADKQAAFFAEGVHGAGALLRDIAEHDHRLAALRRSYWWGNCPDGTSAALATDGLARGVGLAALLEALAPLATLADPSETSDPPASTPATPDAFGTDDESPFGRV